MKTRTIALWMALAGVLTFTMLTSMTVDCYTTWLHEFAIATDHFTEDVQDCEDDPFVIGILDGISLCMWEANVTYDAQINTAAQNYEDCLSRQ